MSGSVRVFAALAGVLAVAATAPAQQPGFRGGPVRGMATASPPITNPAVLQALNPVRNYYVPPTFSYSTWGYNTGWNGGSAWSAWYTPPAVVSQGPVGQYYNVPGMGAYNPWNGGRYSPHTDTFTVGRSSYSYNPWTGAYTSPLTGGTYNPRTGRVVQPAFGVPGFGVPVTGWPY